jgi:hypothetical protein
MCIYEYTVTAKFLVIYSYSKFPAVVRKEKSFQEGKKWLFPIYQKYVPLYDCMSDIKAEGRKGWGGGLGCQGCLIGGLTFL